MDINIGHISKLARLGLSEDEKILYAKQLSSILSFADNLGKLDLEGIPPTSHAMEINNVLREDIPSSFDNIDGIIANGPEVEDNMFMVPRIVE